MVAVFDYLLQSYPKLIAFVGIFEVFNVQLIFFNHKMKYPSQLYFMNMIAP